MSYFHRKRKASDIYIECGHQLLMCVMFVPMQANTPASLNLVKVKLSTADQIQDQVSGSSMTDFSETVKS